MINREKLKGISERVKTLLTQIKEEARAAIGELLEKAGLEKGQLLVIGCSTSEVVGSSIGKNSNIEAAEALWEAIYPVVQKAGICLAVQCCEHLNRALIMEKEDALRFGYEPVNVVPQPKAGGSFATMAYHNFKDPVVVERVKAAAGMDIGNTLIGMHLKEVAVPLRLSLSSIYKAPVVCARTRPKFIGGIRASYDETLL